MSDWSPDVCSSDLVGQGPGPVHRRPRQPWGAAAEGVAESRRTLRRVGRGYAPDMHLDSARAVGGVAPTYGRTHGPCLLAPTLARQQDRLPPGRRAAAAGETLAVARARHRPPRVRAPVRPVAGPGVAGCTWA